MEVPEIEVDFDASIKQDPCQISGLEFFTSLLDVMLRVAIIPTLFRSSPMQP